VLQGLPKVFEQLNLFQLATVLIYKAVLYPLFFFLGPISS